MDSNKRRRGPARWSLTEYTKPQKFFSNASQSSITTACSNAATYDGLVGYTLKAASAADKCAGFAYPIIVGGNAELYPQ